VRYKPIRFVVDKNEYFCYNQSNILTFTARSFDMAEMQEKREYYDDRSLKAVYTLEGKKKHGKYTEYFENSDTIKIAANYDHGVLDG
jgi:antitoxin component YwqK of YwqJK toxin-antitoxin module